MWVSVNGHANNGSRSFSGPVELDESLELGEYSSGMRCNPVIQRGPVTFEDVDSWQQNGELLCARWMVVRAFMVRLSVCDGSLSCKYRKADTGRQLQEDMATWRFCQRNLQSSQPMKILRGVISRLSGHRRFDMSRTGQL
eukprot:TRINITY_DN8895_c0_g1_i1.p1 TRINITY_DN8895_c0_g1~~TRINITY_DN8895_c0_g1_i1.p1  ORF type:complete len:140 (+),score=1.35 TRINITY_DN8895_c0_g1_i1:321-740(+)